MAFYTIHPRDIQNICFQKRVRVVDIREPQEYRKYHCEYGSTSLLAARKLGKEGYEVYTVIGGANAMQEQLRR